MFDGKTFFPDTGIPMRKIACISRLLALAEPVPLTVAILNAKSLTRFMSDHSRRPLRCRQRRQAARAPLLRSRVGNQEIELAHVPRGRRTPLGAQAAMQADIFVLHHDAFGLRQ